MELQRRYKYSSFRHWDIADSQSKAADIIKADNLPAQPMSTSSSKTTKISMNSTMSVSATSFLANSSRSFSPSSLGKSTTVATSFGEVMTSRSPHGPPSAQPTSSSSISTTTTHTAHAVLTVFANGLVPHSGEESMTSLASSTPRIVVTTTKTPSSILPSPSSFLDYTHISEPSTALLGPVPHHHASSPSESLQPHEHLSTSVVGVLSSAGFPSAIAASLVPVIIGGSPEADGVATAPSQMEEQEIRAAIDNFIQWLLSFFSSD